MTHRIRSRPLAWSLFSIATACIACWLMATARDTAAEPQRPEESNAVRVAAAEPSSSAAASLRPGDWPQWGGTSIRNNVRDVKNMPSEWEVGEFDRKTGEWKRETSQNIKWVARLGSQTYGNPVVANGRVYVGTNNGAGHLTRYPDVIDLGCLLAFDEQDGSFLWQHSSEKLPSGRVHDWPLQGICCAPLIEGDRLWFVTSRGEVVCLDTAGFHDGVDQGPRKAGLGNLFREAPEVAIGLPQSEVTAAVDALLAAANLPRKGRIRVDELTEKSWLLTIRDDAQTPPIFVRVSIDENQLVQLMRVENEADAKDPDKGVSLSSAPAVLTAGLDDGMLNEGLRALLAVRGMPIDEVVSVKAVQPGARWTAVVKSNKAERQLELRREGPNFAAYKQITVADKDEADEIWVLDMMTELGVSQHNMCSCSVTSFGDILFVMTSNGVDESHIVIPNINAPSFLALNKHTGELLWSDKSPGANIVHGQWSSPTVAVIQGVPQVIFGGGDGWLYSFRADAGTNGKPELLWVFDVNPKVSKWELGGRGTRNDIIATPVVYKDRVYLAVGQDPEHGEGEGHLWCIDPTRRGDISAELAVTVKDRSQILPVRRLQAVIPEDGEIAIDNPNSGVIWHYTQFDQDGDGEFAFEECMHRSIGTVAIKDDYLYVADLSGVFHCLDAMTGKVHWTHDMYSQSWGSPLIADGKVYIGDEDGEVSIFEFGSDSNEPMTVVDMRNSVYSTPIVANNVLYISNKTHLFAIEAQE